MLVRLPLAAAAGIVAAGITLTAASGANTHKPAVKLSYHMECFALKTVGNDINAQASQGWTVRAMVDHESQDGQECLLVLFERQTP
jgi:hypothetical protein